MITATVRLRSQHQQQMNDSAREARSAPFGESWPHKNELWRRSGAAHYLTCADAPEFLNVA